MQRYFFDGPALGAIECFNCVTHPVFVCGFDDDPWVMPATISVLTVYFTNTWVEWRQIVPAQAGGVVGHMGFFRVQLTTTLWSDLVDWLHERAAATCNGAEAV